MEGDPAKTASAFVKPRLAAPISMLLPDKLLIRQLVVVTLMR